MNPQTLQLRASLWTMFAREPYRLFFPAGVLAGILGVALWPLHLWGFTEWYPGQTHARIMGVGFFGAFIVGFLGTALPRMLSAKQFRGWETGLLLALLLGAVSALAIGKVWVGDILTAALFCSFVAIAIPRFRARKDLPPPGFAMVIMGMACAIAASLIGVAQGIWELGMTWTTWHRLLLFQGFVLLPILGVGPFILPRLVGRESAHDLPAMLKPSPDWSRKALTAFFAGALVIASFALEAMAWDRTAHALRFAMVIGYLALEMPLKAAVKSLNSLGWCARLSLVSMALGFLAVALIPGYRISLMHLTYVAGFATLTIVVAIRVVYGHSGNGALLRGPNRWLYVAVFIMLFGMLTRMSGDFWPKIMATHYIYGALAWIAGALLWAVRVLPKVLQNDDE